jgi:cell division protein FtsQ
VKEKLIKIAKITGIVVSVIALLCLLVLAFVKDENKICKDVVVTMDVESGNNFIDEIDVRELLSAKFANQLVGQKFKAIKMNSIEHELKKNGYIASVELFSTITGKLMIHIEQKKPLVRIINNNGVSFYLGENADTIPLSAKFTPRVLVAFGNIKNKNCTDLKILTDFINKDEFWNACVEEVYVDSNSDYQIYTKLGKQNVVIGKIDDELAEKFRKLKILYAEGLPNVGWNKYKTINLKYKGQIVCTKI